MDAGHSGRSLETANWTSSELSKVDILTFTHAVALANAFGMDDLDYFNRLQYFPSEGELRTKKEEFDRENLLLDARKENGAPTDASVASAPTRFAWET